MLRQITSLDEVALDEQAVYLEAPGGGYTLHPDIISVLDTHNADIAAGQARVTKAETRLRKAVIDHALNFALTAAGVDPVYRRAVSALLQGQMEFEVHEETQGHQAYALTPYGPVSVATAVSSWLMSPGGEPYRTKVPNAAAGRYATMMRALH